MKILVTGGTGFIGTELLKHLTEHDVTAITRKTQQPIEKVTWKYLSLESLLDDETIEGNFDVVIHMAARAHILNDISDDPAEEFKSFNVDVSSALAKQLSKNGMKRLVFISSIGVNGPSTVANEHFNEDSPACPKTDYAISKLAAENELLTLSKNLDFELVIIRPPLVYGNNAPGNFGKLINLVKKQLPLPFGMVNNLKSYISVTNLANFIVLCCTHSKAANQTFLIADDGYVSTKELLLNIKEALNLKLFLLPVPKNLLSILFCAVGKKGMSEQLLDNLQIDNSKAKNLLGWKPVENMQQALSKIDKR